MKERGEGLPLLVRVVAPAGPVNQADLDAGMEVLRGMGLRLEESPHARLRAGYLAGSDEGRATDLQAALDDPAVDVVWFARGGYGTSRILERLNPEGLRRHPKTLVGFSDATVLHAWAQRVKGVRLLYGPGVQELGRPGVCEMGSLATALAGHPVEIPAQGPPAPMGPYPVAGGCLSLLSVLVGTPWEPALAERWLFLEDVGESMYRLDRMMTHLAQAGWFERAAGILLGGFTGMAEGEHPGLVTERARELLGPSKPLLEALPVGHLQGKFTLPLERPARWNGVSLRVD